MEAFGPKQHSEAARTVNDETKSLQSFSHRRKRREPSHPIATARGESSFWTQLDFPRGQIYREERVPLSEFTLFSSVNSTPLFLTKESKKSSREIAMISNLHCSEESIRFNWSGVWTANLPEKNKPRYSLLLITAGRSLPPTKQRTATKTKLRSIQLPTTPNQPPQSTPSPTNRPTPARSRRQRKQARQQWGLSH